MLVEKFGHQMGLAVAETAPNGGPGAGREDGIESVDVEGDPEVLRAGAPHPGVEPGHGGFDSVTIHLVHRDRQAVQMGNLGGVHVAQAVPSRVVGREPSGAEKLQQRAPIVVLIALGLTGEPHQRGDRHAVDVARLAASRRVDVRVGVDPKDREVTFRGVECGGYAGGGESVFASKHDRRAALGESRLHLGLEVGHRHEKGQKVAHAAMLRISERDRDVAPVAQGKVESGQRLRKSGQTQRGRSQPTPQPQPTKIERRTDERDHRGDYAGRGRNGHGGRAYSNPMLAALLLQMSPPTLDDVYRKTAALPGVELKSEMVSPSVIPMEFKFGPDGSLWAKYPTTEQFSTLEETITWMPDRRQFAKEKTRETNPLPVGYETMWPGGKPQTQTGDAKTATFMGKEAWEIPCKGDLVADTKLYIDKGTGLPIGTIAQFNGATYETHHLSVKIVPHSKNSLRFVAPKDAKPYEKVDLGAKLIKPQTPMPPFEGRDEKGGRLNMKALLKGKRGLLVNLWFSACTGCVAEMPALVKLDSEFRGKGIAFVGVNPIDDVSSARRTVELRKLPYRTLVGEDAQKLAKSVGVVAYPVTLMVNAEGRVVETFMGFDEARFRSALESLAKPQ
ncbi:TlpA family protein disulfide reductase [bacterium]|nr:MAG: TlpA family protein disulfide reductase [bacterium]